jgi:ketosteroid isomerase-like protein
LREILRGRCRREEMIEAPGERVVVVESWHARGRDGIEFDFELTDVYTFRDGLVVRIEGFGEREDALEAAGLAQHDARAE